MGKGYTISMEMGLRLTAFACERKVLLTYFTITESPADIKFTCDMPLVDVATCNHA